MLCVRKGSICTVIVKVGAENTVRKDLVCTQLQMLQNFVNSRFYFRLVYGVNQLAERPSSFNSPLRI